MELRRGYIGLDKRVLKHNSETGATLSMQEKPEEHLSRMNEVGGKESGKQLTKTSDEASNFLKCKMMFSHEEKKKNNKLPLLLVLDLLVSVYL